MGREPSKPQQSPQCLVLNARSTVKPDAFSALCADVKTNNIDICCISETWLNYTVCNSQVCPSRYTILRKDRTNRRGGGVAILCRNDWKMESLPNLTNSFECLWVKITTENSIFYVATIYHPPDHIYNPADLVEFLTNLCEQVLSTLPNTKIIIAGDLNKLNIRTLLNQLSFFQMVKTPTRGDNILDVFITNVANYWKKKSFPLIKVRTSTRDPPFISPLVKQRYLLKQRKRAIKARDSEANTRIQTQINKLIRRNQLNAVEMKIENINQEQKTGGLL